MNNKKVIINDEKWDIVYLKDKPSMLFGSMANAYGLVNKGKGVSIDMFLEDMENIFQKALDFTIEISNTANEVQNKLKHKDKGIDLDFDTKGDDLI